jgi:1-acyl-sn-glycerol-3-phosphate acyltransferase
LLEDSLIRRLVLQIVRNVFRLFMIMKDEDLENLPPDGAVILSSNRVTNLGVFPIHFSIPGPIDFMGKAELFNNPLEPLLRILCAFPVIRGEKDEWAVRRAAAVLECHQVLGMFPEGSHSMGRGLGVARTGTARLAIEAACPIIPVAVIGPDPLLKTFPRRARVTVKILPPILPIPGETPIALTDRFMFALAAELPREMRGVYARRPKGFGN